MEVHTEYADRVQELFESTGLTDTMQHRDLNDLPRIVVGKRPQDRDWHDNKNRIGTAAGYG